MNLKKVIRTRISMIRVIWSLLVHLQDSIWYFILRTLLASPCMTVGIPHCDISLDCPVIILGRC